MKVLRHVFTLIESYHIVEKRGQVPISYIKTWPTLVFGLTFILNRQSLFCVLGLQVAMGMVIWVVKFPREGYKIRKVYD